MVSQCIIGVGGELTYVHIPEDFDSFIVNIGDAASDSDSDVDDSV